MKTETFKTINYTSAKTKQTITLQVGNLGTIKTKSGTVIKQHKLANGYMYLIGRSVRDFKGLLPVHRIVCTAYGNKKITSRNRYIWQAAHLNGNRLDNRADNLAWQTRKQNNGALHTRKNISKNSRHLKHPNQIIKGVNGDQTLYFVNGYNAAQYIGCSHVLVYNVINPDHWAKKAKGWSLKWIDLNEVKEER